MKTQQMERYQSLLLQKRTELAEQLGIIRETSFQDTIKNASGDNSAYAFHMADQGTDTEEREKAFMLAHREGRLIYHIDEALERIKNGTYGLCLECGKSISVERLEAVPHARLCIECKSKEESEQSV